MVDMKTKIPETNDKSKYSFTENNRCDILRYRNNGFQISVYLQVTFLKLISISIIINILYKVYYSIIKSQFEIECIINFY